MIKSARRIDAEPINALGQKTYVLSAFLFNIAQKPLFPIIEWIAGSVLKCPFLRIWCILQVLPCPFLFTVTRLMLCGQKKLCSASGIFRL